MPWPTVIASDVADIWRPLTPSEITVATARIATVEAELRRRLRLHGILGTPTVGDPGYETYDQVDEWETLYKSVVTEVVKDALLNPEGWLEEREDIDDWSRTRRRDAHTSTGQAFLTDDLVQKLLPVRRPRRNAFTIRLSET